MAQNPNTPRHFSWDGAINVPTIVGGVGAIIAFASTLAVAQDRISRLEDDVGSMPERVASMEATLKAQSDLLHQMDSKIDKLQTDSRDDRR